MRHVLAAAAAALLLTSLAACDFVRFPGDGGPEPTVPEAPPVTPPGAPGPPPPDVDESEFETPIETPGEETPVEPGPDLPIDDPTPEPGPIDAPEDTTPPPVDVPVDETPVEPEPEVPVVVPEPEPVAPVFSYFQPGALLPGSGGGFPDQVVHAPNMLFPIKSAPAVLQSQVFAFG
ncbi:MAG: hypothetical protein Q8S09_08090, partial [Hyphomonas sp.]|nr:hypothetical protein [Hyphomonas sp.]